MKDNVFTAKPSSSGDQTALLTTVSCSLKRKRPPKIEIPNVLRQIPTTDANLTLQDSQSQEDTTTLSFSGFAVALSSIKGKKMFMEDTHKIVSSSSHAHKVICIHTYTSIHMSSSSSS